MAFPKATLKKFAHLSRIAVSDGDLDNMNISGVIDWIDQLQKINTDGVEPLLSPANHDLRFREDIVADGNIRDSLLANVPDDTGKRAGYFAVPKIIEGE
ncbi:MAG: Asp-tRNA(Asn)/Glu-tRNA(Gln) amidotransferase subunit GatC [Rickettsiales bacterium]|jgi:aspartyl-tRNA(Asn)/glutamyl-tRNA(Gln) amidotransferase subunit C|nr:Asp-tRNA(Asn)/Glu-tRNA(Gln) amidotransferase subunit GatC [Rickettsiales bacterium]